MNQKEFFIRLDDGTRVPVTADVYYEITRSDEREKKFYQREKERMLSLDYEYEEGATLQDFEHDYDSNLVDKQSRMRPEDAFFYKERIQTLSNALCILSEQLRKIVKSYYFDEKSDRAIAEELGWKREKVTYQRNKALELMKKYFEKN